MAIGERRTIKQISDFEAEKVVETVMVTPSDRKIRLDIWKIPSTTDAPAIYIFTANNFIQCHNTDKTPVLCEMASYMAEFL